MRCSGDGLQIMAESSMTTYNSITPALSKYIAKIEIRQQLQPVER